MNYEYAGIFLIPLNVAITEGLKMLGLKPKLAGVVAVLCGLVQGVTLFSGGDLAQGVIVGASIGLSSVGLYSTSKNTKEYLEE